ncbi:MAG TPA: ABC transporter ATP-binding protein [Patescibacteria group bacterium]|jgi:cobalt/nickel transport system ATP-binding protein|nr:ABC transporter ATP-binding protein [Patescibacteria group bacterium]
MNTQKIFEANNLSFEYEKSHVLDSVSFEIHAGERIAILGANGSGKSTLLKLLNGLEFPTGGQLSFFGKPLTASYFESGEHEYAFRQKVGFVFQDPDVQLFNQTVWDEIIFGPLQMNLSADDVIKRGEWALDVLNIKSLRDRTPFTLSGGEKKRVAIASILSMKPIVWLMDEPLASLDPKSQSRLIDFIDEAKKRGETLIMTTHDLSLLAEMADRVLVLSEDHKLVADATVDKVLGDTKFLVKHNLIHDHRHGRRGRERRQEHIHVGHTHTI